MRDAISGISIALLVMVLLATSACSSKKYDSWSECISGEMSKLDNNVPAAETYCDSNYDMTQREANARHNWYCRGGSWQPGCGPSTAASASGNEPAEEASSVSFSNQSAEAALKTQTSSSATALIPTAFLGEWNEDLQSCGTDLNDSRLVVSPNQLTFYESEATVRNVRINNPRSITVTGAFSGEGESWNRTLTINLSRSGRELTIENFTRYRCS